MRVNIIGNHRTGRGLAQDVAILHGLLAHVFGEDATIRRIPHFYPQCPQAEINVFLEVINPSLFAYASRNIWIPNPEWTQKTWLPYARMVDEIWVKTHEAEKLFWEHGIKTRYIGWTSIDKVQPSSKNYRKALVPVGTNLWRNPKPILQAYLAIQTTTPSLFAGLPELHIVHVPAVVPVTVPESLASKVVCHPEVMSEADYDALVQECGLCICMSAAEGFGHAVNEAMSTGSVLILSPIDAFRELSETALWVSNSKVTPHPHCLGSLEDIEVGSLVEALTTYCSGRLQWRGSLSNASRTEYETRHQAFVQRMTGVLSEFKSLPEYSLESRFPKEEDLPCVSVITLTRNRRPFIPLALYCMTGQSYPEEKIEWVIVDDGVDQIKDLVSDRPNVTYVLVDEPMTIGAKRNLAVQTAKHDVLVMMDDDDVYPNNSILTRVAHLLAEPAKECVMSTTIPCYEIHETKSFMNVPPNTLGLADRVSEATMCFTRAFWEARKFPDQQIAEGGAFLRGREGMCREVSPQDVIVSLCHSKTTSSRRPPPMEANGCHYGFSDELFTLVSEIAARL